MNSNCLEEVLLSLVNFVPYAVFIIYVFWSDLKVSRVWAYLAIALSSLIDVSLWLLIPTPSVEMTQVFSIILTIANFICYIAVVKIDFFHAAFRLLVVNNIANFVVVEAKFLEGLLFPQMAWELSHWTYSLCMFLLQLIILGGFTFWWKKRYAKNFDELFNPTMWRYLCLIPGIFYIIWHYVMYHTSSLSSLEIALDPTHVFFQTIIFGGQVLIYICVYKLIAAYNKVIQLEMENNVLSIQSMQYKLFQKHLNEVRIMRHDIRHHLQIISSCVESGNTDALKAHLQKYTKIMDEEVVCVYCKNTTLNMILNYYVRLGKENSVDFDIGIGGEVEIQSILSESEIAVLFGNLLENAYDACLQQVKGKRKIAVHAIYKNNTVITIDNTFANKISKDSQNKFLSTKHSGYGLGTLSARNIVQRHQGTIRFETREENFCVSILLPRE